ncbi:putative copper efflux system periplasmic protein CusF [Phenylobacterium zucineum HLK1]|uniref:Putative copper efflux system periplasmic protein CusF n=1 Tax=Phenylobacterium zucineum (strain HLK1) TaxID=450851 RepID=B4R9V2_PHEZH|nr:copper-binding protein [Phenylobacterium zucineum]ACG77866.1 putative copper efflux system periplasmic protein CusF [Phenylobacterium zucineum HLK1]
MKRACLTAAVLSAALGLAACGQGTEPPAEATPAPETAASPANGGDSTTGMNMASAEAGKTAKGTGTVTAVDPAAGTITIAHGPIPEAGWPAMTMGFKAAPAVVRDVEVGDKVAFDLRLENGAGEITAIRKP